MRGALEALLGSLGGGFLLWAWMLGGVAMEYADNELLEEELECLRSLRTGLGSCSTEAYSTEVTWSQIKIATALMHILKMNNTSPPNELAS